MGDAAGQGADGLHLLGLAQAIFQAQALLLGLFACGDVQRGEGDPFGPVGGIQRGRTQQDINDLPVLALPAGLDRPRAAGPDLYIFFPADELEVLVGGVEYACAAALKLFSGIPQHLAYAIVHLHDDPFAGHPDSHGCRSKDASQGGLSLPKRIRHALVLGEQARMRDGAADLDGHVFSDREIPLGVTARIGGHQEQCTEGLAFRDQGCQEGRLDPGSPFRQVAGKTGLDLLHRQRRQQHTAPGFDDRGRGRAGEGKPIAGVPALDRKPGDVLRGDRLRVEIDQVDGDAVERKYFFHLGRELLVDPFDFQGGADDAADLRHDRLFQGRLLGRLLASVQRVFGLLAFNGGRQDIGDGLQEVDVVFGKVPTVFGAGVQDPEGALATFNDNTHAADNAVLAHEIIRRKAGFGMDVRHQHRLIPLEGVAGLGALARFDDGLSDQILKPRQSGPHGQHVYPGIEFKHLAVLDLQDPGCGADRFVEKIVYIRSGQGALPQPCHRFLFESPYPQLLFRVPALGDVHPHRLSAPSRDGESPRHVVPGYGAGFTVFTRSGFMTPPAPRWRRCRPLTYWRGCCAFEPACALPSGVIRGCEATSIQIPLQRRQKVFLPVPLQRRYPPVNLIRRFFILYEDG